MAETVSVVCVTYNSADHVVAALRSAVTSIELAGAVSEVIVVDNASSDLSVAVVTEAIAKVRVIPTGANLGYAAGSNRGMRDASGSYYLLLNPDASIDPPAVGVLMRFLESHPQAGAAGPSIRSPHGGAESAGMQPGLRAAIGHFLFVNRSLVGDRGGAWRGFQLHHRTDIGPRKVDWASAAVLLVRREAMEAVGGFDERYFLYGEDQDLGRRLQAAGWETWIVPAAAADHLIAGSQRQTSTRWLEAVHDDYAARSGRFQTALFDLVVAIGLAVRAAAIAVRGPSVSERQRRRMQRSALRAFRLVRFALSGRRALLDPRIPAIPPDAAGKGHGHG